MQDPVRTHVTVEALTVGVKINVSLLRPPVATAVAVITPSATASDTVLPTPGEAIAAGIAKPSPEAPASHGVKTPLFI